MNRKRKKRKKFKDINSITDIEWENAVKNATSFRGVAKFLGICKGPKIKEKIDLLSINYNHFTFGKKNISMIGKKFNKLTILGPIEKDGRKYYANCLCDCGETCNKRIDSITSGKTISCGCAIVDKGRFMMGQNNHAYAGVGDLSGTKFYQIKRNANRRNIEFNVTKKYLWDIFMKQDGKCALSGQKLWFGKNDISMATNASLDRIDSKLGYIKGNLQWVHKDINLIKRNFNQEYFILMCKMISDHLK